MKIKSNPISIAISMYVTVVALISVLVLLQNLMLFPSIVYSSVLVLFNMILWKFLFDSLKTKGASRKKIVFYLLFSLKLLVNVYIIYLLVVLLKVKAVVILAAITLMLISLVIGAYVYKKGHEV